MNAIQEKLDQSVNVLAFDTSRDEASVALYAFGEMHSIALPLGTGSHSQAACLFPTLQELLHKAHLTFQDLHVIATPVGPGSFTGLRLGIAAAQGLQLATKAECYTPTTFQMVAFDAWRKQLRLKSHSKDSFLVTLTTKRSSFYSQAFNDALDPLGSATIFEQEEVHEFLQNNPGMLQISQTVDLGAESLIHLYFHEKEKGTVLASALSPFYLHDPIFVKQTK